MTKKIKVKGKLLPDGSYKRDTPIETLNVLGLAYRDWLTHEDFQETWILKEEKKGFTIGRNGWIAQYVGQG